MIQLIENGNYLKVVFVDGGTSKLGLKKDFEFTANDNGSFDLVHDKIEIATEKVYGDFSTDGVTPFASLSAFEDFAFANTGAGNFNTGEATPQKYYRGYVSQFGTDAPILTTFENTLGYEPIPTYSGVSSYNITLENTLYADIFICSPYMKDSNDTRKEYYLYREDDNLLTIISQFEGVNADGILNKFPIEFYVKQ